MNGGHGGAFKRYGTITTDVDTVIDVGRSWSREIWPPGTDSNRPGVKGASFDAAIDF
jgi:hypothetical protein